MSIQQHYYDNQIKRYLIQFMAIFAGMGVEVGKTESTDERIIRVPIHYGSKDRVSASILADNTQNKSIRLPIMSAYQTGIEMSPELRKGVGTIKRDRYIPRGGLIPDDIQTVRQIMPVPYKASTELAIYTSNMDQHHQIIEQIMLLFDPILQIQTSDAAFDWTKISTVELTGINFDENYPAGTDRRMITSTFLFEYPMYISAPANLKKDYVNEIHLRIDAADELNLHDHLQEQIYNDDVLSEVIVTGELDV